MVRKILAVVVVVLMVASASYAGLVSQLTSIVKATASGISKTVSNSNPAKIISDTTEGTVEAGQKAGEATVTVATDTTGVVGKAVGSK